jgi:hypothetical protein
MVTVKTTRTGSAEARTLIKDGRGKAKREIHDSHSETLPSREGSCEMEIGVGMTRCEKGSFSSVRSDVRIRIPFDPDNIKEAEEYATDQAYRIMDARIAELQASLDESFKKAVPVGDPDYGQ